MDINLIIIIIMGRKRQYKILQLIQVIKGESEIERGEISKV